MLYQIDDLKTVVETAKRLLTKEQIDKKSGQATTSPFMQTSQDNSKSKSKAEKNEKKVSFSAVEAIERTTDSIERLASLTLSTLQVSIVAISHLVKKVPLQELLSATEFSVRLV